MLVLAQSLPRIACPSCEPVVCQDLLTSAVSGPISGAIESRILAHSGGRRFADCLPESSRAYPRSCLEGH